MLEIYIDWPKDCQTSVTQDSILLITLPLMNRKHLLVGNLLTDPNGLPNMTLLDYLSLHLQCNLNAHDACIPELIIASLRTLQVSVHLPKAHLQAYPLNHLSHWILTVPLSYFDLSMHILTRRVQNAKCKYFKFTQQTPISTQPVPINRT